MTPLGLCSIIICVSIVLDVGYLIFALPPNQGAFSLKGTVNGEGTPGARFGSSMASAGDINGDGYNGKSGAPITSL